MGIRILPFVPFGVFLAVFLSSCLPSSPGFFKVSLEEIDIALRGRKIALAERLVASAGNKAGTEREWLSLLKRSYACARLRRAGLPVGAEEKAFGPFAETALKAAAGLPGNRSLARAAVKSLLISGNASGAARLAEERLSPEDDSSLYAEAILASLQAGSRETARPETPGFHRTAEAQELFARETGEPAFLRNAALLHLAQGAKEKAGRDLVQAESMGMRLEPEIAFDAGLYREARELSDLADAPSLLMAGDSAYLLSLREPAIGLYRECITQFPRHSWAPYYNLSKLYSGDGRKSLEFLEEGYAEVKASPEAALALAMELTSKGNYGRAKNILGSFPGAVRNPLIARGVFAVDINILDEDEAVSRALALANLFPGDGEVFKAAMFFLLSRKRWDAAFSLFGERGKDGDAESRGFLNAFAAVYGGRTWEAIEILEKRGAELPSAEAAYDLGILYDSQGEDEAARQRYGFALENSADADFRLRARNRIGLSYRKIGNERMALASFRASLNENPGDPESIHLIEETLSGSYRKGGGK